MNNKYSLNSLELFKERVSIIFNKNNTYTVSENKNNNEVDRYILSKKVGNKVVHTIIIYLNEINKEILLIYYIIGKGKHEVKRKINNEVFNKIKEYLDNKLPNKIAANKIAENKIAANETKGNI